MIPGIPNNPPITNLPILEQFRNAIQTYGEGSRIRGRGVEISRVKASCSKIATKNSKNIAKLAEV